MFGLKGIALFNHVQHVFHFQLPLRKRPSLTLLPPRPGDAHFLPQAWCLVSSGPDECRFVNWRCTLESLCMERCCTDTLPAYRGQCSAATSKPFLGAGLPSACDGCVRLRFVFMRLLRRHSEQLHIRMKPGGRRRSQRGGTQIQRQSGSEGETIPTIIITLLLQFMN